MGIDSTTYQQMLQQLMAGQGAEPPQSPTTPGDPYQARIDQLIQQLSAPDVPQQLPIGKAPGTAQSVLALLADALTNVGAAKSRKPLPGPQFTGQVAQQREYNQQATAENARRTQAAAVEGRKTGAMLSLKDVERQHQEALDRAAKSEAGRQRAWEHAASAAESASHGLINPLNEDGSQKAPGAIYKELSGYTGKMDAEHDKLVAAAQANQAADNARADKQLAISERNSAREDRRAQAAADSEKPDKVAERQRAEHVRAVRQQVAELANGITSIEPDGALTIGGKPYRLSGLRDMLTSYAKANEFTPEESAALDKLFKETIGAKWNAAMLKHTAGSNVASPDLAK